EGESGLAESHDDSFERVEASVGYRAVKAWRGACSQLASPGRSLEPRGELALENVPGRRAGQNDPVDGKGRRALHARLPPVLLRGIGELLRQRLVVEAAIGLGPDDAVPLHQVIELEV